MKQITTFFKQYSDEEIASITPIPPSGSSRKNFIIKTVMQKTYIVTHNENVMENDAFFYFSKVFMQKTIRSPQILHISADRKTYVQDFLGEKTLSQIITEEGLSDKVKALIKQTLLQLFELQSRTKNAIDFSRTFEYEAYDNLPITHDLYYFKNFLVDVLEIHYHKSTLLKEFKELVKRIENLVPKGVMIRDFQSRNIMVDENNKVGFIDYQSAMEGPLMYDVVSFLFQAKANFPADFKAEMLGFYVQLWDNQKTQDNLKSSLDYIKLIRFMQVLGAYGFRGLIQRKAHFLASLEQGIINLTSFAKTFEAMKDSPELLKIIQVLETKEVKIKIKNIVGN